MSQKPTIVVMIEVSKKKIDSGPKTNSEEWGTQIQSFKNLRSREVTVWVEVDAQRVQGYSLLFKQNHNRKITRIWL